jgi:hypothetical protein
MINLVYSRNARMFWAKEPEWSPLNPGDLYSLMKDIEENTRRWKDIPRS